MILCFSVDTDAVGLWTIAGLVMCFVVEVSSFAKIELKHDPINLKAENTYNMISKFTSFQNLFEMSH